MLSLMGIFVFLVGLILCGGVGFFTGLELFRMTRDYVLRRRHRPKGFPVIFRAGRRKK